MVVKFLRGITENAGCWGRIRRKEKADKISVKQANFISKKRNSNPLKKTKKKNHTTENRMKLTLILSYK